MKRSAQKVVSVRPQGDSYIPWVFLGPQKRIITRQAKTETDGVECLHAPFEFYEYLNEVGGRGFLYYLCSQ